MMAIPVEIMRQAMMASRAAIRAGLCGEIAPNGFVCTRPYLHASDEHRAAIVGGEDDGHILEVWPATAA